MKFLRRFGVFVFVLIVLVVLVGAGAWFAVGSQLESAVEFETRMVDIPTDPAEIARGKHLTEAWMACFDCHGSDLGGRIIADSAVFARFSAPNITTGQGGVVGEYTAEDWVRAIRHGVDRESRPLVLMPSAAYLQVSDEDLGAVIAYLQTTPPVDREMPETTLGPMGRVVEFLFEPFLNARLVDHTREALTAPPSGPTVEYGRYLGIACMSCHGEQLDGEGAQGATDLLVDGTLGPYDEAQFMKTLRTGVAADHRELDPDQMPWTTFRNMKDDELRAIWLWLQEGPQE